MAKVYDPILCMMVDEKVNTKDSTLGSVEEHYNKMVGKSKSEVEKIVASAKGNPNADLAYKKWKGTSAKDSLADLHGAIPVGKGYVKVRGYDFAVYNAKGELKGTYASPDEAEEAARNLDECPEGMTCDKRSIDEAIRMCDSEQYYEFKLTSGVTYYGTENDFREFMSGLTKKEKEEYGKLAYKSPKTKEYVENWRNKAMNKLGL